MAKKKKEEEKDEKILNFYEEAASVKRSELIDSYDDFDDDDDYGDDDFDDDEFEDEYFDDDDDDFDDDDDYDDSLGFFDTIDNMSPSELDEFLEDTLDETTRFTESFSYIIAGSFSTEILHKQLEEIKSDREDLIKYFIFIATNLVFMFDRKNIFKKDIQTIEKDRIRPVLSYIHINSCFIYSDYFFYKDFMLKMEENWDHFLINFLQNFKKTAIEYLGEKDYKKELVDNPFSGFELKIMSEFMKK